MCIIRKSERIKHEACTDGSSLAHRAEVSTKGHKGKKISFVTFVVKRFCTKLNRKNTDIR